MPEQEFFCRILLGTREGFFMKKIIIVVIAILIFAFAPTKNSELSQPQVSAAPSLPAQQASITYNGKEGVDALALLKEQNTAEQNSSGLVTIINGRKAEDSKREYWAFYVNGEMATVGPGEYVTKDTDRIEWRVEKY
jgi:hypothetical protein